ncbi:proteasome-activating nucleotidase [Haloarcula sp. K1]|uniref:proteasome-activating nucleotidase n=1 Tax=Haloarcula sp. K1 TaxID=1622207 RepID=UPI0007BAEA89|nr:proteasome-activating nucleotidase [Haloarcula sp. K1]KZX46204.1 peptidase [Haloarcula sp. K1]
MNDSTDSNEVEQTELGFDGESATQEDRIEELAEENEMLRSQNEQLEMKLVDANAERNKQEQKADRLRRENQKLKDDPLFIATVQEVTDDGLVIKQHGNNQEALTEVTDEKRERIEAGDRVTINNALSIVDVMDSETDTRVQAMQIDQSPDVTYADIGGVDTQLAEVRETVEMPLKSPEMFNEVGINPPSGILLHGPPGTGKTMLAKAVANQTDATFIKMAGSELVHKFIGEGSKLVRDLFETARENEPAVLFIDEIDAIASKRTDSKTSGDAEVQRTLMQLLSELDGFDDRGDVRIIAATNRFDMLDDALLRPGRFDRLIEVPKPAVSGRKQIFEIHSREMNTVDDIDFEALAEMAEDTSGAEIEAICTEAGMFAIRDGRTVVKTSDFEAAYEKIRMEDDEDTEASPSSLAFA